MSISDNDALAYLSQFLPPGFTRWMAVSSTDTIGKILASMAQGFNAYGHAVLDTLRTELDPSKLTERLADWEEIFRVGESNIARFGTIDDRRRQLISRHREWGTPTPDMIRAVIGPMLGYANPSQLTIVECVRSALDTANAVSLGSGAIPAGGVLTLTGTNKDRGVVSDGGARLNLTFGVSQATAPIVVRLTAPDGYYEDFTFPAGDATGIAPGSRGRVLRASVFAGHGVYGTWTARFTDTGAAGASVVATLNAEGFGRAPVSLYDGLSAAIFEWSVLVDQALWNGTLDWPTTRESLRRLTPGHTRSFIVFKMSGGSSVAIADDAYALADACICA